MDYSETGAGAPISALATPTDETGWKSLVEESFTYLRNLKRAQEYHWREALLFLAGEQWVRWESQTNRFFRHNLDDWVPTPVTNYCVKYFDRLVDLLTSGETKPGVRPATDDQRDIDAAEKSQALLAYLRNELGTPDMQRRSAGWLVVTGNVILRGLWDPRSGSFTHIPRTKITESPLLLPGAFCPACDTEFPMAFRGQTCPSCGLTTVQMETRPLRDRAGNQIMQTNREPERDDKGNPVVDRFRLGQVAELDVNPFKWFPEPKPNPADVRYGIEAEILPVDEIADMFGSEARGIQAEDVDVYGWGSFLQSTITSDYALLQSSRDQQVAVVKWFRSIPTGKFPKGALAITAGGRLLYQGKLEDYLDGRLPYEHIRYRVVPGELWGVAPMRDIIPSQKRLNAIDQSIVWNRKTMVSNQWLIPKGSGIKTIDGRPSLKVIWDWSKTGPHKPERLPGLGPHPSMYQEREMVIQDMETIVGTVDVLMGNQPSGVNTLGQTQILTEQALRRFAPIVRGWKDGWVRHEQRKLMIVKAKWDEPRMIKILGENEQTEILHFAGSDVGNSSDVYLFMENELLYSRAMQEQKIMDLAQRGWLGDLQNPEVRGKVLEVLNVPGFLSEYTLDAKLARRRLMQIQQGAKDVQARSNDVHPIHFKILSDYTKTAEYDRQPPEVQTEIANLMTQHQNAMMAQAQQAMAAAQATKGTGPATEQRVAESGAFGGAPEAQAMQPAGAGA